MDYSKLNFKAGIEIHQQLEGKKLFCDCPTLNTDKEPDTSTERKLRAVIGEMGKVDQAAAHEMAKGKSFKYVSHSEDTCEVEYDEEPPKDVDKHHLHTALMVCQLLNAKIVDEAQVMRKIVVDGSNVSGFQRTILIGTDGYIETSKGRVNIPSILLEEEAAQKLEEKEDQVTYKLDRLGIPLLEISTDGSLKDPEHVKEAASIIGMVLRSTERVKRGIGTIRQDVNVSIEKGNRTEVKGFQELKSIPKIIESEVKRQKELIDKNKSVNKEVRRANSDLTTSYLRPMPGEDRLYPETDVFPIRITKEMLDKIELPELITEKSTKIQKEFNISDVLAKEIVKNKIDLKSYTNKYKNLKPEIIAQTLINIPKDLKSRLNLDPSKLKTKDFEEVLDKLNNDEISKDSLTEILSLKVEGKKVDYSKYQKADDSQIEQKVKEIVDNNPGLTQGAYMGMIMKELKGQVDGKKAMEILKKFL